MQEYEYLLIGVVTALGECSVSAQTSCVCGGSKTKDRQARDHGPQRNKVEEEKRVRNNLIISLF